MESRAFLGIKLPPRPRRVKKPVIPIHTVGLPIAPYWNASEDEVLRTMKMVSIDFTSDGRLVNWPSEEETREIIIAFRRAAGCGTILQFAESLRFGRWRDFVRAMDAAQKDASWTLFAMARAVFVDARYWKMFGGRKYFSGRCPFTSKPRDLMSCLRCDLFDLPAPDVRSRSRHPITQPMRPKNYEAKRRAIVRAAFLRGRRTRHFRKK